MFAPFDPRANYLEDDPPPDPPAAGLSRAILAKHAPTIDPNSAIGRSVLLTLDDAIDGATRIAAQYAGCFLPHEWEQLEHMYRGLDDAFRLAIGYGLSAMERKARHADKPVQAQVAHARLEQEDAQSWLRKAIVANAKVVVGLDEIFGMNANPASPA